MLIHNHINIPDYALGQDSLPNWLWSGYQDWSDMILEFVPLKLDQTFRGIDTWQNKGLGSCEQNLTWGMNVHLVL